MDRWKIKAAELVVALALTERKYPAVIPYKPQKTFLPKRERKYFARVCPEKHGVSNSRIYKILDELERDERARIHSLLIIKDSEVIAECSREGYDVNIPHQAHSMSKSLTAIAIIMLFEEGLISPEDKVCDIFPEYTFKDKRFADITLKHLLTNTSGISFNEAGSVTETEWTRAAFNSRLDFAPGTKFAYNSMNTYLLSRTLKRVSALSLTEYLTVHLFMPLGIKNGFWECSPEGVEKGGWGAYLSVESFAKIGEMMSKYGVFDGERIISEKWVREAISPHVKTPDNAGDFSYGYQIWVKEETGEFLFNGMLGQNVWVYPKEKIVVSMTAENNEMFQRSAALDIIRGHLTAESLNEEIGEWVSFRALKEKEANFFSGRGYVIVEKQTRRHPFRLGLARREIIPPAWKDILGTYTLAANNQGILPLFVRIIQNNYTGGIESITLEAIGDGLFLTSHEGGCDYKIPVGIGRLRDTILNVNGESYLVLTAAEMREVGTKRVFRIEIIFPELTNSRRIELTEGKDGRLIIKLTESPDQKIGEALIEAMYVTSPKLSFALKLFESKLGDKIIMRKLAEMFSPTLIGINKAARKYYELMNSEDERQKNELRVMKPVSALIMRSVDEEAENDENTR